MTPDIVIYHKGCTDGFTAAWLSWRTWPDAEFIPVSYGEEPTINVKDKSVLMVDFSFKRPILEKMAAEATEILVLDHHKSAQADLEDLPYCIFDMEESGASLMWQYIIDHALMDEDVALWEEIDTLVNYVRDRDLWLFEMPDSEEVHAAIDSYRRTFENWDYLLEADLLGEGTSILRYQEQVMGVLTQNIRTTRIAGYNVPTLNSATLQSELGNMLCEDYPFAAIWYMKGDGRINYSLRSNDRGVDVSNIAKLFGGGGHQHAAGFVVEPNTDLNPGITATLGL
jgi:oligoribonuclease NrnB/cAMP/cGMP phosphodiesterase (DHH superfamily)